MLGQIANYCPVISRSTTVKNSTSIDSIWQAISLHFLVQTSGAHFLDERPEDLYQRLMAFIEDILLSRSSNITHHDETVEEDEDVSPTLENFNILQWLHLINEASSDLSLTITG